MPVDRRHPHQPFDPSFISGFLRGREILSAALLPAGKSNSNYKLILSDGETCVLRLYSRGGPKREAFVMNLVKELVPVPVELAAGEKWAVFSFLEGELLESVPEHSGAAAEALAKIASVIFDSRGWINVDGSISPFAFGGVNGFIIEKLADAKVRIWPEPKAVDAIFQILENERTRLDELDAESRLVHGDFNPTNVLIHHGKANGILDWEFCHSGTPYMDIGNLLRHTDAKYHREIELALEAGGMNLPDDWKARAELVDLTSHLEFLTSDRSDEFKRLCVAKIEGFIAKFNQGA